MKALTHNPLSLHKKINRSGFTLIELAVVIVIVGIIISIMATVLPSLIKSAKIKKARAILEKVDYSLEGYIAASGQFPCPDTDGDGLENRNPGANPPTDDTCDAYVGDLPYLTLGLSSGEDNWHNPVKYAVYEDLIRTTSGTGSNYFCYSLRDILNYYRTNPADTGKLYTTDSNGDTNQAYLIASGGAKDLDGTGGFFDGLNSGSDVQFESPNKIVDANYDDLVRAVSFSYLGGRDCAGDGGGGGGGVENSYPNGCTNGIDDDGDGMIDCDDPDCFGASACLAGGENVQIVTESMPSGNVNTDYSSVTFTASGGITPYEWELLSNGGFDDFYLHPYTGHLSGTLSQCPGNYPIQVKVIDSTQPTPTEDTKSFNIDVTADLEVARTSGDQSTNITWDSPTQQETFEVNGGHLGDIDWELDTGGADGFTVVSTGSDTCVIKKVGATTTAKTYGFVLTAKDSECLSSNTADITLSVTVEGSVLPAPYTANLIAKWRLDECSWNGTTGEVKDSGDDMLDGTAQNGANTIGSGKVCRAGKFDGSNDYVSVPDDPKLQLDAPLTLALWVEVSANASDWVRLAGKGNSTNRNYGLWLATNGTILFQIYSSGGNGNAQTTVTVNDGKWHHVVGVYDGSTMKVYIDKIEKASIDYSQIPYTSSDPFTIAYAGFGTYMNGYIDEVALFSEALSEDDITNMYNDTSRYCSGACYTAPVVKYMMEEESWGDGSEPYVQDSMGSYHGTAYNGANTVDDSGCKAGDFDSAQSQYVNSGNIPISGNTTVSFWLNASAQEEVPFHKDYCFTFIIRSSGEISYADSSNWSYANFGDHNIGFVFGEWNHIVVSKTGSTVRIYRNGDLKLTKTFGSAITSNSNNVYIGSYNGTSSYYSGLIDEVIMWDRGLSESTIKNMYETGRCAD